MDNENKEKRILIADDQEYFRTVLSDLLSTFGYTVDPFEDGEEAVIALKRQNYSFSLGVIDLHTPVVTGIEIISEIRQNKTIEEFPIIAVTSVFKRKEDVVDLLKLRVNQFIYKCTPFEDILYLVNKLTSISIDEKRMSERIWVSLPVSLKYKEKFYKAIISNLSTTGAFVKIEKRLTPKSPIDVSFNLNGELSQVKCRGLVIHKHETPLAPYFDSSKGYGIHFTNLKENDKNRIKKFINHIKRESIRIH